MLSMIEILVMVLAAAIVAFAVYFFFRIKSLKNRIDAIETLCAAPEQPNVQINLEGPRSRPATEQEVLTALRIIVPQKDSPILEEIEPKDQEPEVNENSDDVRSVAVDPPAPLEDPIQERLEAHQDDVPQ